ncbi:MAG: hypothetical protein ACOVNQ_17680, partial [Pirellula sp.]
MNWFAVLVTIACVLLVTVVATAILNNSSYLEFSQTGHAIWHIGAYVLAACCFTILLVTLREQIEQVIDQLQDRFTFVKSFLLSLSL